MPRKTASLLVLVLCLTVFSARLAMSLKSSEPNGLDGYFYALEARSFAERGYLENPSPAPAYYIAGVLARLTRSPVLGVKLCSALFSALIPCGVFLVLSAASFVSPAAALAGAAFSAVSPSLALLSLNYLNNLAGLAFLLFYLAALFSAPGGRGWGTWAVLALCGVLAVLSHRVSAVYLAAATVLFAARKLPAKARLAGILAAGIAVVIVLRAQGPRFASAFSPVPLIPIASKVFQSRLPLSVVLELSFYPMALYALAAVYVVKTRSCPTLLWGIPLLYFPFWNLSVLDMGYRLFLAATPLGILGIFTLASLLVPRPNVRGWLPWVIATASIPLILATTRVYQPERDPPYDYYRRVIESIDLPDDSLLIAHLGLNHVYTYYKGFRDCLNYEPDFPVAQEKLWRIAYGVPKPTIYGLFPDAVRSRLIQNLPGDYLLVREDVWQSYLKEEDPEIRAVLLNAYNPHTTRPGFIRSNGGNSKWGNSKY
jgi:hypothetical protein